MATGFAPYLLANMKDLAGKNYAGVKIRAAGMTAAAIDNSGGIQVSNVDGQVAATPNGTIKLNSPAGQVREVRLKYLQRNLASSVQTSDTCAPNVVNIYKETTLAAPYFRSFGFFLPWSFLEQYQADSIRMVQLGGVPAFGAVKEMQDQLMAAANAIISQINDALLSSIVFGTNKATGLSTQTTININKNATVLDLANGIGEILYQMQQNEVYGKPIIVGNGNIARLQTSAPAIGMANSGLNQVGLQNEYDFYLDLSSQNQPTIGTNGMAIFEKGSFGFVDIDKFVGWKAGRFGVSEFMTIDLPISTVPNGPATMMRFNLQIKEYDCPSTQNTGGYAGTTTVDRGYSVILSKNFGLYQSPTDIYASGDPLSGVNGAFNYALTNTCVDCA